MLTLFILLSGLVGFLTITPNRNVETIYPRRNKYYGSQNLYYELDQFKPYNNGGYNISRIYARTFLRLRKVPSESAQVQVTEFKTISGNQKPDGRLDFTYTYNETTSAAEQVEIYLVLLKNATTSYVDELITKNAGSSDECKQSVKNCQSSIPESSIAPLQDKVKEKRVKIQEIEVQLRTNFNLCFSLRTTPPPTCVTGKQNILMDLAKIISKNEMSKLNSLLKDSINCVKAYLDSCVKN